MARTLAANLATRYGGLTGPPLDRRDDRLLSLQEVCDIFRVHRCTLYRRRKRDPRFPTPVHTKLSADSFWESEIYAYLALIQNQPLPK
jgi:predicted DNA-binding transcriptional regulator AlpA